MNIIVYFIVLFCLIFFICLFFVKCNIRHCGHKQSCKKGGRGTLNSYPTNPTHIHSLDFLDKVPKSRPLHFLWFLDYFAEFLLPTAPSRPASSSPPAHTLALPFLYPRSLSFHSPQLNREWRWSRLSEILVQDVSYSAGWLLNGVHKYGLSRLLIDLKCR